MSDRNPTGGRGSNGGYALCLHGVCESTTALQPGARPIAAAEICVSEGTIDESRQQEGPDPYASLCWPVQELCTRRLSMHNTTLRTRHRNTRCRARRVNEWISSSAVEKWSSGCRMRDNLEALQCASRIPVALCCSVYLWGRSKVMTDGPSVEVADTRDRRYRKLLGGSPHRLAQGNLECR